MDMEDALRLNASGVGIQVFIGGEFETRSVHNMTRLVDLGMRHGMPVMAVTAVGKDMKRDAQYFRLACGSAPNSGHVREDLYTEGISRPSPLPVRSPSSWPAARSCGTRCPDDVLPCGPGGQQVSIWGGTSSRAIRLRP